MMGLWASKALSLVQISELGYDLIRSPDLSIVWGV